MEANRVFAFGDTGFDADQRDFRAAGRRPVAVSCLDPVVDADDYWLCIACHGFGMVYVWLLGILRVLPPRSLVVAEILLGFFRQWCDGCTGDLWWHVQPSDGL